MLCTPDIGDGNACFPPIAELNPLTSPHITVRSHPLRIQLQTQFRGLLLPRGRKSEPLLLLPPL